MHPPLSSCHSYDRLGGVRTAQMLSNLCLVGACAPEARRTSDHVFARREGMKVFLEGVPRNRGSRGCGDYERPPMARRSSEPHPWGLFGSFLGKPKGTRLPLSNITKANRRNSMKTGKILQIPDSDCREDGTALCGRRYLLQLDGGLPGLQPGWTRDGGA